MPRVSEKSKAKNRLFQRGYNKRLRLAVLAFLGGDCANCGFRDWRALQIDHKMGNGAKERREWGSTKTAVYYKKILSGEYSSENLQVLCANCNWIKRYEQQEYV